MNLKHIFSAIFPVLLLFTASVTEAAETSEAIFAGGCFWCTESDFEKVSGVEYVISGYVGGHVDHPTYKQVSAGGTGHAEAVKVGYDPDIVSYEQLLEVFWHSVDPLAKDRQFCDGGHQYRSVIFYLNDQQKMMAESSRKALADSGILKGPIQTEISAAGTFWKAEEYHQDYYKKNPIRYKLYRYGCGRDARLEEVWGDKAGWTPNH
ncbi:peptide-methionine (S)-S-oxide reductase [Hahella sp. CCB-MM4]|uniref:peptide-methionine (S)-S-oxide reductase MsrA n=1 Tax=Hahella sp. (strain CCB-MM4) TaxID=1926491 RepID=UPI000B9AAB1D|nr:peptide-methionine (S)-S-oxide reductase MsrA [Hahella sp. CCB-MM4]OZG73911.1 peptide-methionine (S)-S-oxide reductase [Hahella sp. CCB-MM4]